MLKMVYGRSKCERCGKEFEWRRHKSQKTAQFCSKKCWYENNAKKLASFNECRFNWKTASDEEKKEWLKNQYEKKVIRKEGCWDWSGVQDKDGYGQMNIASNKQSKAHRISWNLHKGTIPIGIRVLHKCDNPVCTNPEHLFLGTAKDNSQDMAKKGRSTKGEKSATSKLTNEDVKKIKMLLEMGVMKGRIAKDFNVSRSTISCIRLGKTWKHIKETND